MKLVLHITLTVLSGLSLASLLTGCAIPTKEDIARSTTEFNLVAEKAGNEMLLLNIVRASKRRPMYFTSIGKLTGNKTFEYSTGSITIPFGRIGTGTNGSYSIAPSAGYKNSPLFDVAVLNTKEFTNGIMTPVPMKTIEYYWSQGWHPDMLLHLFIRRIDIIDKEGKVLKEYHNYPGDPNRFADFQNEIRTWGIKKVTNTMKIGELNTKEATQLKDLMEAQKAGLILTPVKKNNKVQGKSNDEEENKMKLCLNQVEYVFTRLEKSFDKSQGTIYLRSPEAILYYLGEILRAEIRGEKKGKTNPNIPKIDVSHDRSGASLAWLFYARKVTNEDTTPCVSVDYEGTKYVIPGDPNGYGTDRSMHVLSLVSQLIGLQKTSEEVPSTGVVSVIGR